MLEPKTPHDKERESRLQALEAFVRAVFSQVLEEAGVPKKNIRLGQAHVAVIKPHELNMQLGMEYFGDFTAPEIARHTAAFRDKLRAMGFKTPGPDGYEGCWARAAQRKDMSHSSYVDLEGSLSDIYNRARMTPPGRAGENARTPGN